MTQIPIPFAVSAHISELAVRRAREGLVRRGWKTEIRPGEAALEPAPGEGLVGVRIAAKHLVYQNRGIRPFLMTSLEGKTVPINGRLFRVRGVGMPGMGYQNRKYDSLKGPVYRQQRWRHPGIQPERFVENAISQAILESRPKLVEMTTRVLSGRSIT